MQGTAHRADGTGRAFAYALAVHVFAIALLVISFHLPVKSTLYAFHAVRRPIVAQLVNGQALAQARERIKAAEMAQQARVQAALKARAEAQQEKRAAEHKAEEQARAAAQAVVRARALAAQHAADLALQKRRQQLLLKQQEEQKVRRAADRKRRIAQLKRELSMQQEHARQAADRRHAEQALARQLAAEANERKQALNSAEQAVANRYLARIRRQVSLNWVRPPGTAKDLECVVQVRLLPQGDVVSARIVDSSGDPAFDRSVQVAVYRASPLPLPSDPALAATFRKITFTFKPEH
ncbi:MAG: cell envelope integrity protein TolA [Acidiferrobacteraceae bacterium]